MNQAERKSYRCTHPVDGHARRSDAPGDGPMDAGFSEALRTAWRTCGGAVGILVASAPTIVFVAVSAISGLITAVVLAAAAAVAAFSFRMIRHERLGGALGGLAVAAVCASVAALTGEARGFFLLPTLLPAAILLVCLGSVIARRPLTGLLLNRVAGGPADWRHHRGLMRIYDLTTMTAVAINLVNFGLQAVLYTADQTGILAAAHIATGPIFATLVAATLLAARRRLARDPAAPDRTAPDRTVLTAPPLTAPFDRLLRPLVWSPPCLMTSSS